MVEIDKVSPSSRVLLVGHPEQVLGNPRDIQNHNVAETDTILEAIALFGKESYDMVFIEIAAVTGQLIAGLKSLVSVAGQARVYLLAQMYEEPLALDIVHRNGAHRLADDYFICPLDLHGLLTKSSETPVPSFDSVAATDWKDDRIRELEKLATEDDLTQLKNRRYVYEFLTQVIDRSRFEDLRVTLLVFDIDNFKHYNDTYGHAVGDNVLKQVAVMMRRCCRAHDIIARIGGDEFAVVFWDLPDGTESDADASTSSDDRRQSKSEHPRGAMGISERFRHEVSHAELSFLGPAGKGVLTISGGLASFPRDGETVSGLLEKADHAMFEAKRLGKNQIYIVGPPHDADAVNSED